MKNFKHFLVLFVSCSLFCNAQSPWIVMTPQNRTLNCVTFSSFNYGCAVGVLGTVLNTEDNGNTWNIRNSETTDDLNSVCFTDGQTGYSVGLNGTILKTSSAGNGWVPLTSGVTNQLFSVKYMAGYVVAAGINSTLLKSTNGLDWTNQWSEANCHVSSICFADATTGFAACADGKLLKTTDAGANWYLCNTGSVTDHLNSVCFPTYNVGYVVGYNGLILKTNDAWSSSFYSQNSNVSEVLNCVHFVDEINGYAVGTNGTILKTTNGGDDWVNISYGNANYKSVFFLNTDVGFIVGSDGIMLKTTTGGVSVEEWSDKKMSLYPNPVKNILFYDLKGERPESMQIYDVTGKMVLNENSPKGNNIDINELNSGIYYITFYLNGKILGSSFIKE